MEKEKLEKIRDEAFSLATKKYEPEKFIHSSVSPIYFAPTGNIIDMMKLYKNKKKILTVGGMGAFAFECALNGAEKVDIFDINELQKVFFEVVCASIEHLTYEDFIKYFTFENEKELDFRRTKNLLSQELYEKLDTYLNDDIKYIFYPLYDYFDNNDLLISGLYRTEYIISKKYLSNLSSIYKKDGYYKLQNILKTRKCEFKYKCDSVTNLDKLYNDKYDLIILGNILQYYKDFKDINSTKKVNNLIINKLRKLLSYNGEIQVNYGFEVVCSAFKKALNLPYENPGIIDIERLFIDIQLDNEIKNGINYNLFNTYDKYSYDFISGVEKIIGRNSDNLILTYNRQTK